MTAVTYLGLVLQPQVKVGDLLTAASVLIAGLSLAYAVMKERGLRRRAQADLVRTAAAQALAKLLRWFSLARSLEDEVQDVLVETSELVKASGDVTSARDHLWKGLNAAHRAVAARQREEDLESAYVQLYGRRPEAFESYRRGLERLEEAEQRNFAQLLEEAQEQVLSFRDKLRAYQPAQLGNLLRGSGAHYGERLESDTAETRLEMETQLRHVIEADDERVLDRRWRP